MTKKITAKQRREALAPEAMKRREFLTHVAAHTLAGVALSVGGAGILAVRHLVQDAPARSQRSLLRHFVDIDHSVQIFAGNTNKLAALSGKSGIRVRTIFIAAPQQAQTMGARSRTHAEARGGTNFSSTCSNAIKRLQFGCRKPKLRARRNPLGSTCCNTSQRKSAPATVRCSIRPVLAWR